MPDKAAFFTFLVAALALNLAPGPDMLYVIGRSVGQGRRAGIVSALGIFAGCLVHIALAAVGVAAILRSSALAFDLVRYAGAVYLLYLGLRILLQRKSQIAFQQPNAAPLGSIFRQGVVTNILNPKVALFFLAFLPQFISGRSGGVAMPIIVLGMIFNAGGTLVNLVVAYAGGHVGNLLRRNARIARLQRWFTGLVFVGLGFRLGLSRR